MNSTDSLHEKIEHSKDLDFDTIFSDSIELFKKTWLQGFLLVLFTIIIMMPLIIVLYIPMLDVIMAQQGGALEGSEAFDNFFAGMSVLYVLFVVVGIFVLGAISFALNAGFYRIIKKLDYNEIVETSDFFHFIKKEYLSKAFLLMLVSILIAILSVLLCYTPLIYMIVPLSFIPVIFAFNPNFTVGEIIKSAFKLANKKWLISFGLIVVCSILSQIVGYLLCGIGLLFTASFVYHPIYIIYKNIIGFNESHIIDE